MMVNDAAEEIEPAMISQSRFGFDYVVTVYMKFNPDAATTPPTLQFATYTSNGLKATGSLPTSAALSSYNRFADPVLAQPEGVTNPRIYLVALGINDANQDSAIIIWSSDNGGWNWTAPSIIEAESTAYHIFDEPAVTVAPNGSVHVAYIDHGGSNLMTYRSSTYNPSTGQWAPWYVNVNTDVLNGVTSCQSPQVMVDSNNDVYILYTDDQLSGTSRTRIRLVRASRYDLVRVGRRHPEHGRTFRKRAAQRLDPAEAGRFASRSVRARGASGPRQPPHRRGMARRMARRHERVGSRPNQLLLPGD
jgi:hypothetical protein